MTEAQLEGKANRSRSMQVRALNRLSKSEFLALGDALAELVTAEAALAAGLGDLRRAAEREARARRSRNLPGVGPYVEGYLTAKQVLAVVTNARESLSIPG